MNSVKITYIICIAIFQLILLAVAILTPIYITPGYYWWTAFCLISIFGSSSSFSNRLNSWGDMKSNE